MEYLLGFIIAAFIALTGVGAGTITTPLLILFLGVPTTAAVTTGLIFSAAVKLVLVPAQIAGNRVSWKLLGLMLLGGLPGVLLGAIILRHLDAAGLKHIMNGLLGGVLVLTAAWQLAFSFRKTEERAGIRDRRSLMPWLMLPVGAEVGFSSAGAGALGTAALLSLTTLSPAQVVGTDILFGFVLSLAGTGAHWGQRPEHIELLRSLIIGGVGGVLFGAYAGRFVPRRPLRLVLWAWLLIIGCQFLYSNATDHHRASETVAQRADRSR